MIIFKTFLEIIDNIYECSLKNQQNQKVNKIKKLTK